MVSSAAHSLVYAPFSTPHITAIRSYLQDTLTQYTSNSMYATICNNLEGFYNSLIAVFLLENGTMTLRQFESSPECSQILTSDDSILEL